MDEQRIQSVAYQYLCRLEEAKSLYLYRLGLAPQIQDLYGKVKFTEEEISNMKLELDKYGIQMPAFNKIGGILTNELSVDEAAGHAAVIAINEALDHGQTEVLAAALRNPNAQLSGLQEALMSIYQELLLHARASKKERAANRCGGSEEKDIYEEFLTRREIQDSINLVNVRWALEQVDEALDAADEISLLSALQLPCLALRGLRTENGPWYLEQLSADRQQKALAEGCVDPLEPEELQEGVSVSNKEVQRDQSMHVALQNVNTCLRLSDPRQTLSALMTPDLQLPEVFPSAATLYHRELQLLQRRTAEGALQQEELFVAMEMLSAVALINQVLEAGHMQEFSFSLVSPSAGLSEVEPTLLHRYFESLLLKQQQSRELLTWNQLQEEISIVNESVQDEHQQLQCVGLINSAVLRGDAQQLLSALLLPSCELEDVLPANSCRYMTRLTRARQHRAQVSREPGTELWLADIQEAVRIANQESQRALKLGLALAAVNQAVKEDKVKQTLRVLMLPELQLQEVLPCCSAQYQRELHCRVETRSLSGDSRSPWVRIRLEDGSWYYLHLTRLEGVWEQPAGFRQNPVFLVREQIQEVVSSISASYRRSALWRGSEALITRLQALSQGFLLRQQLQARRRYLGNNTASVVIIQAHWRRVLQQKTYQQRLQFLYRNWRAVVKIQAAVRMWSARRKYRARLSFFRRQVGAVVKIQAFFRASRARGEYRMLVHTATPPLSVVRKFLHLLDLGDGDIREEAELLRLREEVVRSIRSNRQLEADLHLMDLKIGLLVRNRATLQEVVSHCKKLTRKNKEQLSDMMDVDRSKGLKALSRERRDRLEAYQHLFYLLQTQPLYLAQLIFLMPQSRSTCFMEMLVFSLFNYGSDCRAAFLLLQLFTEALRYEIRLKVEQPQDVVTGNPTVIKMMTWINQTETKTGTRSSLPYEVSAADALLHPEVQRRIDVALINLENLTERVFKAITSNLHRLPYGLRYMAKVLRDALQEKFPEASEDELYKIVGNLVYYRYMNPALVAPDGFDVLQRSAGSSLQPEQRHLLGCIARMLQHAAANKLFPGEGSHLKTLNQFISQTHVKFRKFLRGVCDVPEPEDRFNMDEFSELLIVNKPVVYISVSELRNTHQLLLEHQQILCPDPSDPLRQLLQDLGSVPSLQELSGDASADGASEVSLTLTNKFDIFNESNDKPDARGLLLSTKQLVLDVIRTQPGDSLRDILRGGVSQNQELSHDWLLQRRAQQDARRPELLQRNESLAANGRLRLQEKKKKILRNLRMLQGLGVLRGGGEDHMLQIIAKDIRQQRLHRQRRGGGAAEAAHYITSCLDQLTTDSKSTNKKAAERKKKLPALSYSAARLQEKGVLLEIQDLPPTQFKNVVFDIVPGPDRGSFTVKARFLGVEMEEFLLQYQDLLQMQYEGVAVMKMFDKAKVNVNLLIFLLNKKFFKK
ncbi:hypothetical protein PBY51_018458 [Eleginops maclovinus]|uniref:Ras-GAP domain-containing protein n=1 Tax=Eleginops maclovinus TaxID=56733 RepID=A0AAN7Y9P2_ELEMC|nr:hypothetical protein PBY51_018458 [Eleginops maclovinus]